MPDFFKQILEHASSQGYKSNVLKPLFGLLSVLLLTTIVCIYLGNEIFANICLTVSLLIVVCFLVCYFYCLFKSPDLLRSEKFNLEKTAMEKIALGDSSTGRIKIQDTDYVIIKSAGENSIDEGTNNEGGQ